MIFLGLFLACGDKSNDTAELDSLSDNNDTIDTEDTVNSGDTASEDTEDSGTTTDTEDSGTDNEAIRPTEGSWTVFGPEFTVNTCGGGESFPETRPMILAMDATNFTMLIEAPGEYTYNFSCELSASTFSCADIVIENSGPFSNFTLYYQHQVNGSFSDNNSLSAEYQITTTCTGGADCSESNLGFTTPCEQSGIMTAVFEG